MKNKLIRLYIFLHMLLVFTLISSCGEYEPDTVQPATSEDLPVTGSNDGQQTSNQSLEEVPFVKNDPRYNPKLDNKLVELIDAYERGVVEEYANRNLIKLRNGDSILVTMTSMPGQMESAKEAVLKARGWLGAGRGDSQDIIVQVGTIVDLTLEESISYIEIPMRVHED